MPVRLWLPTRAGAPVYDLAFAAVMRRGREAAAEAVSRTKGRVLDVGVGTGLELPMFARATRLIGIDLAEAMLRRAQSRVNRHRLGNVEGLSVMDATQLAFPAESFEAAVVPYVLTVVPDPHALLSEIRRVVKRGGEIILVNHFGAEGGIVAKIEAWLGKRSAALGWHPQFAFSVLGDWIAAQADMHIVERRRLAPFGLFTLVRLRREAYHMTRSGIGPDDREARHECSRYDAVNGDAQDTSIGPLDPGGDGKFGQ